MTEKERNIYEEELRKRNLIKNAIRITIQELFPATEFQKLYHR